MPNTACRFLPFAPLLAIVPPPALHAADTRITTEQVVVTATRIERNSFDLPVSIDVVEGETLRDGKPLVNLTETAVRIPGVVVNNRYNASQDLAVSSRGFGARASFGVRGVRIYADGIPITMPDGQGQTGTFNLDTAKSVEFMRGPFSALYGNSSGGVVHIHTRDGELQPTLGGSLTAGSYDTLRESLTFEGQNGGLNYIVNATDFESDGYREHSRNTRETLHAKLRYSFSEATRLTLLASTLDQFAEDPLGLTEAQYRQDPRQAGTNAIARNTRVYRKHEQAGVVLDHALSAQDGVSLTGYRGTRDNQQYQTLGAAGRVAAIDREFGGTELKWTQRASLADRPFNLAAGVNYDSMEDVRTQYNAAGGVLIPGATRDELQKVHNVDEFVQATFEPGADWLLVAGLRHTDIRFDITDRMPTPVDGSGSLRFSNTSPVVGATYRLLPTLNLYANYGRGFETPTFIELTYVGNPTTNGGAGPNLELQPSKSRNYEVGAKALIADNTRVNLAAFRIDTENEIVTDLGNGATASFKNAGRTQRVGIELAIDSALPYEFNVYGAFSWMTAKFRDDFCTGSPPCVPVAADNRIPGTYGTTAYVELSWQHPASGFATALEGVHFGHTYTNDSNVQQAEGYSLYHFRAGFAQKLANWRLREFLRIENLTDETYVSSVRVNASQADTGAAFEPGARRNAFVGIAASYTF
ncbi:MAG: TonB-dependent receptor [Rhodocyclales bacterium]|nr:TonB-dependent receptor [Rhodocyclales bacterium]